MPSAHAHAHDDDDARSSAAAEVLARQRPISFAAIDRVLEESAEVVESTGPAPVRAWRDGLTLALEALGYARAVLAADVGILRHCLATEGPDDQTLVDDLPAVVTTGTWGEGWSAPDDHSADAELDPTIFVRSDPLMSAHQEMARTDLSSPEDVVRTLGALQEQLVAITERETAVERRLRQIRATIVRQYKDGVIPTKNWPG